MFVDDDHKVQTTLAIHAHKLSTEEIPRSGAYILTADRDGNVSLDASFMYYTRQQLTETMDVDRRSVQWLMRQVVTTEQSDNAFVAGVLFVNGEVLCHVFPKRAPKRSLRIR
jgi:hypothetical protein